MDVLTSKHEKLLNRLQSKLPSDEFQEVARFSYNALQGENNHVKARHIEKFRRFKERNKPVVLSDLEPGNTRTGEPKDKKQLGGEFTTTPAYEGSVLNKGLNYVVSPQTVPVEEFVVATEVVCDRLDAKDKEEIRSKVTGIFHPASPPSSNISREERQAIKDLKKDNNIVILPADKGKITVVLDSSTYEEKVNALLSDTNSRPTLNLTRIPPLPTKIVCSSF